MARLRYVDLSGTIGSGNLTNSATSHTFTAPLTYANGTTVPTLAGSDFFILSILNTAGTAVSEVVKVTAYNSGTGAATIVRGQEGTTGAAHTSGDKVLLGAYPSDFPPPSADDAPASANAKDDEFDGTTSVTWTATPTAANVLDVNSTSPGELYVKASGSSSTYVGRHQPIPGAYPFTIITKVTATTGRANNHRAGGIILGPASPTGSSTLVYLGVAYNSANTVYRVLQTFGGTFSSQAGGAVVAAGAPLYLKMVCTSATSIATYWSGSGKLWSLIESGLNPGFTPGVMGLACSEEGGSGVEFTAAFFRVT